MNDGAALDGISACLPPGAQTEAIPAADCLYRLCVGNTNLLTRDGARLARSADLDEVLGCLESDLHFTVALNARGYLFVHAGVVSWRGRAIVIPGRSFSGKTTLVRALVEAGATYYSDEYAVLDADGRVHPYPKPLSLRDAEDGSARRCTVAQLGGDAGSVALTVGLILVTKYRAGVRWRPRRLSPGCAALALLDNSVAARRRPDLAMAILPRVLRGNPVTLKGDRGDARALAPALQRYIEQRTEDQDRIGGCTDISGPTGSSGKE